jgi:DNA polymerase
MKVKGRLVVPMFHPAAALHQQSLKPVVEADFTRLPDLISQANNVQENVNEKQDNDDEPKQLNLF